MLFVDLGNELDIVNFFTHHYLLMDLVTFFKLHG
jgi:hypothetical protein